MWMENLLVARLLEDDKFLLLDLLEIHVHNWLNFTFSSLIIIFFLLLIFYVHKTAWLKLMEWLHWNDHFT